LSQGDTIRKLAEMKAYVEKRVAELNQESAALSSFLDVIDDLLAERSFRRVEIPKEQVKSVTTEHPDREKTPTHETTILAAEGAQLGEIHVEDDNVTVIPRESIKFEVNSPPLQAFLLARVLEPMRVKDAQLVREGKLQQGKALTYALDEDKGILRSLVVHNFGDEKRLSELRNAFRWTFRRMYEKSAEYPKR
jgi:hypothetical protein